MVFRAQLEKLVQMSALRFLSNCQIAALIDGAKHKLSRSSLVWAFDNGTKMVTGHRPATIKSLWNLGLLDANFDDPRGVGSLTEVRKVQNLDGARFAHSPDVPQLFVWTNARGVKLLQDNGLLPGRSAITYH
jgi:hypothetical protein